MGSGRERNEMLKFQPIFKSPVWGGNRIAAYKGIEVDVPCLGESWELSGLEGDESIVAEGPDSGMTLRELLRREQDQLVGKANWKRFGELFPLLVKFIDARCDLSIQVHPNDRLARERHACSGKSEMWYVVHADEEARLRVGFNRSVSPEEYEQAVEEHRMENLMSEYSITPGDLFYLPAGRIHTIGAGSMLVEIQQPSNITYRIYDYGRPGVDGKPRELHTELAREAIDFSYLPDYRIRYDHQFDRAIPLVSCDHFTTTLFDLTRTQILDLDWLDSFVVVVCTAGVGQLVNDKGEAVTIRQGETVLVPASVKCLHMQPQGEQLKLLAAWIEG